MSECPACGGSGLQEVGREWFSWESGCREDDFETVPCFCEAGQRRREEVSDGDDDAATDGGDGGQLDL